MIARTLEEMERYGSSPERIPPPPPGRSGWPWERASSTGPIVADAKWPRITIVIPSYNQGRFIEETIRSVLLQDYPDLELIVFDGGSTDESVEVIRKYEQHLAYWASEADRGQTHAINKGLERATGEIFSYLNSDDLLMPDALFRVAEGFAERREADVLYGGCVYMDEAGTELFTTWGRVTDFVSYLRIWERLARREFLTQPEVFCRTEALVEAGGFREELRSVMDLEMWLRLLARGRRFEMLEAPIAKYRLYAGQKSSVDPGDELCSVVQEYVLSTPEVSTTEKGRILEELEHARAHFLIGAALAANMLDRYPDAIRYSLRAAASSPRIVAGYEFWAVLANPLKKLVRPKYRRAIQNFMRAGGA